MADKPPVSAIVVFLTMGLVGLLFGDRFQDALDRFRERRPGLNRFGWFLFDKETSRRNNRFCAWAFILAALWLAGVRWLGFPP
jgi:hypothetical protein